MSIAPNADSSSSSAGTAVPKFGMRFAPPKSAAVSAAKISTQIPLGFPTTTSGTLDGAAPFARSS